DTIGDAGSGCGRCRLEGGSGVSMSDRDSRVSLEPPTEFLILARVDGSARLQACGAARPPTDSPVTRLRTFTPDCDIDAAGMPLVWLNDVAPDEGIAWLATLVAASPDVGETHDRVAKQAIGAIAMHNAPAADATLDGFVAPSRPDLLRADTAFSLGSARGAAGAARLARMMRED